MNRTFLLGTAWTASAAAAVGLGFLAVALVDASASPGTVPVAASSTTTGADDTAAAAAASTAPTAAGREVTVAGIVNATCATGSPRASGVPSTGWWLDDSPKLGEVEFESATQKLEVKVTCVDGSPRFEVEGPRGDDNGDDNGGDDSRSSSAPASTDAPDDSDGRVGGGHGSDDSGPDDSDSRHGDDDSGSDDSDSRHGGDDDSGSDDSGGSGGHGSDD